MTEDEAIAWTREHVDAGSFERIEAFVAMVVSENEQQNLISPASVDAIWSRHVVDSLQLLPLANDAAGTWLDIGTGGGFPGMIVAIARPGMTVMVEPRRKRVEFLQSAIDRIGLDQAEVRLAKVERVTVTAGIISARAVASIENLLRAARHCATTSTRWLLPRGSVDRDELARTAAQHGLMFHVEQSLTQAESSIVVLEAR